MKNKLLIGVGIIIGLFVAHGVFDGQKAQVAGTQIEKEIVTPAPTVVPTLTPSPIPTLTPSPTPKPTVKPTPLPTATPVQDSGLSNDNYYTNSAGNEVHSPAYSDSVPAGATAICGDGTYSFSQSRRGTCSRHGGVAQWL